MCAYTSKEQFRCLMRSLVPFKVTRETHGIHAMSDMLHDLGWGWTLVHPAELSVNLCPWHTFAWATSVIPALLSSNTKVCIPFFPTELSANDF